METIRDASPTPAPSPSPSQPMASPTPTPTPSPSSPPPTATPTATITPAKINRETLKGTAPADPEVKATINTDAIGAKPDEEDKVRNIHGYDEVDFNVLPNEHRRVFRDRFNHVYRQLKQSDRNNTTLIEYTRGLEQRLLSIEAERNKGGHAYQVASLEAQLDDAYRRQDFQTAEQVRAQLIKAAQEGAPQPKPIEYKAPEVFDQSEVALIQKWRDSRPWGKPDNPWHQTSLQVGAALFDKHTDWSADRVLTEIDRVMQAVINQTPVAQAAALNTGNGAAQPQSKPVQQPAQAAAVLGNNANFRPNATSEIKLTTSEKYVAHKMHPSLTHADAENKYLQSKRKIAQER